MNYYYLSESEPIRNIDNTLLLVVAGLVVLYILYVLSKPRKLMRLRRNRNQEDFMDVEQYNELQQGINTANSVAKRGYSSPLTSCGY